LLRVESVVVETSSKEGSVGVWERYR
jgi:hypothetical protein